MNLKQYFLDETNSTKKFTVILGSGIHGIVNKNSILSNWEILLAKILKNDALNYHNDKKIIPETIRFERAISQYSTKFKEINAARVEEKLLKKIAKEIISESNKIDINSYNHLSFLKSPKISDVISLNFDLTAEKLNYGRNIGSPKYLYNNKKILKSTRHRTINHINFWHPHGDINSSSSMQLSFRNYTLINQEIEILRKKFKSNEHKPDELTEQSWVSAIMQNPVIILGASLSYSELDLWQTFINRERNFLQKKNSKYKEPIFILTEGDSHSHIPNEFYFPIISNKSTFQKGWNELNKLLK